MPASFAGKKHQFRTKPIRESLSDSIGEENALSVRLRQVTSRKGRSAAQEMDVPCENVSEFARSNVGSMRTTS